MDSEIFDLVIGLGSTGASCVRYLADQSSGVRGMDLSTTPSRLAEVRGLIPDASIHVGSWQQSWLNDARRLIVSPGVPLTTPEIAQQIAQGKEVIGDIELFAKVAGAPVIAITGSNAKSTVTTLIAQVLLNCDVKAPAGGNLGTPALDLLDRDADCYVLELSSFQLETTWSLSAQVACFLNISQDHLDRYPSLSEYMAAKQRIFRGCEVAVWNRDDPATQPQFQTETSMTFGVHPDADFRLDTKRGMLQAFGLDVLPVSELRVRGHHNALNIVAVLAMSHALALPQDRVLETVRDFPGLPHRCQFVAQQQGVQWFNDSKATNVGATLAAIQGLGSWVSGRVILIGGGRGKGQDFSLLQPAAQEYLRAALLLGEDAAVLQSALCDIPCVRVPDMQTAVRQAALLAQPGDIVLLSPACASLDMYDSYVARGADFVRAVQEIVL